MNKQFTDIYRTIATPSEGLYKEKGSKFIGLAYPVTSEDEIRNILTLLRKEYFDARHHCYAYKLGQDDNHCRANDDGEPNHSAGDPILGQIRSAGLTNILVVVVRYFGGTKLGVSGLIQAYKTAASEALAVATVIEKVQQVNVTVTFDYAQMNAVMGLIKEYKSDILEQDLQVTCRLVLSVRKALVAVVTGKLANLPRVVVSLNAS